MPTKDLIASISKYGVPPVLLAALFYWTLSTLTGRLDAIVSEQHVTNIRLMSLCVNSTADPVKLMNCMGTGK